MKTWFFRHKDKLNLADSSFCRLIDERRVGVMYENIDSSNPLAYKGSTATSVMHGMAELARDGGYVCAEYDSTQVWVGKVAPSAEVEIPRGMQFENGDVAFVKTLTMTNARPLTGNAAHILLSMRPMQGTCVYFNNDMRYGNRVQRYVEQASLNAPEVNDLIPSQLEVLCEEFLRAGLSETLPRIAAKLLRTGGTLRDVDIAAIDSDGNTVLAQVSFESADTREGRSKLKALKENGTGSNLLVFFCNAPRAYVQDSVSIVPIKDVFQDYTATAIGTRWIEEARQ